MSGKCRQEIFDYAKQSATDTRATSSKRVIQKEEEGTCDLIGYNIANKIMKVSKNLQYNDLEAAANEHDYEIPKERYISSGEKQKIIDDLGLK